MRDNVPSLRYSAICNVLRQWKTSLILTYRVYRLYDSVYTTYTEPSLPTSPSSPLTPSSSSLSPSPLSSFLLTPSSLTPSSPSLSPSPSSFLLLTPSSLSPPHPSSSRYIHIIIYPLISLPTGGDQCPLLHAAVPLWGLLFLRPSQGAGVPERGLDCRVHCAETQIQDRQLHPNILVATEVKCMHQSCLCVCVCMCVFYRRPITA